MDDQATLAIAELRAENARLRSALNEQAGSRARIVSASDDELRRIERNLHDGAQQRLVTLALRLRQIGDQADGQDGLGQMISDAREELALATEELRELARGLHPAILTTDGLPGGLEDLAFRSPLPVELVCPEQRYPEDIEATAYFLVSEALTNAAKHARATLARVERVTPGRRAPDRDHRRRRGGRKRERQRAACSGWWIGSRRWEARSGSTAQPEPARASPRSCRATRAWAGREPDSGLALMSRRPAARDLPRCPPPS